MATTHSHRYEADPDLRWVAPSPSPADGISVRALAHSFDAVRALDGVSLSVRPGEVHALLGPNGAGKTTLLRILSGLITPAAGSVYILGEPLTTVPRGLVGLVPSGDRSFYLRISGIENLIFFARLNGLRLREARARARDALECVGLGYAAERAVGRYSHGMQKRLSLARALLSAPPALLVDEATHDLDPEGAERVRDLVRGLAAEGAAVLWATQRLDEIRGFAGEVTCLVEGQVRFAGPVSQLIAQAESNRFVVRVRAAGVSGAPTLEVAGRALGPWARVESMRDDDPEHLLLAIAPEKTLGWALTVLAGTGLEILACRQERSELEDAFLAVTSGAVA